MSTLSPSSDQKIAEKYTSKTLEKKAKNKTNLQKEIGWSEEPKRPVICLPMGMSEKLGGELFQQILPGLLSLQMEILVLGKGSSDYGNLCTQLAKEHSHRFHIMPDTPQAMSQMLAAADMALFLSEPDHKTAEHCLSYGTVPVSPKFADFENYNAIQETGNAFLYDELDMWNCFAAVVRAVETHKFPFDWKTIQKHGMEG